MKTTTLFSVLAVLACLPALNPQLSAAPLGTAFTYQGKLTDGVNPANGSYNLKFTLYDASGGGALVAGPLTNSPVGVTNGLFTVMIDFGEDVFDGSARWLEIAVRTNGSGAFTTLNPRQELTPAPYSLFASNTALLNGQAASAFAPASGSTAYVTKSGDTMTGTLNLPANGLVAGGSQLVLSGGKVGIGTSTPGAGLEVAGPGMWNSSIGIRDTTTSQDWRLSVSGTDFWITKVAGTTFTPFKILATGTSDSLVIGAGGNVGIGTASPTTKLDVAGTVRATSFSGPGAGLTGLNASSLGSGTVSDARLSTNVALRNSTNTFSGDQNIKSGNLNLNGNLLKAAVPWLAPYHATFHNSFNTTVGTGTITTTDGMVTLNTGNQTNSVCDIQSHNWISAIDTGFNRAGSYLYLRVLWASFSSVSAAHRSHFLAGGQSAMGANSQVGQGWGFKQEGIELYGVIYSGTVESKLNLTTTLSYGTAHRLLAVVRSSTSVEFYVDGVSKGTLTATLPTSANTFYRIRTSNNASTTAAYLVISQLSLGIQEQ